MNRNCLLIIIALAMMLGLVACEPHSNATSTLPTSASVLPTLTPLPSPTWTQTVRPGLVPTDNPVITPSPRPTTTPCPTPTPGGPVGPILFSAVECVGDYCEPFSSDVAPIYIINSDGSGMRQIYTGTGVTSDFQLSPDGTKLAFTDSYYIDIDEQRHSSGNVSILDLASGQAWVVAPGDPIQQVWGPRWVSNEMLVYAARAIEPADSSSNIYLTNVHGEWRQQLTHRPLGRTSILDVAISPDSAQLLFAELVLESDVTTVYRMDMDGTELMELITLPARAHTVNVAWSPTGDRIVFYPIPMGSADYAPIYTAGTDGSEITEIAILPGGHILDLVGWTEDQTGMIFYACSRALQAHQIVEVQGDGNARTLVTIEIPGTLASTTSCSLGELSPDQQRFALSPFYPFAGNGNLYVMDMFSGCCHQILSGYRVQSILWLPEDAFLQPKYQ